MEPFEKKFARYLKLRGIDKPGGTPSWPTPFGVAERDKFYTSLSFDGWGGASGDDSVLIAYDAVLACNGSWEEFAMRGILHGGDNDSTGPLCRRPSAAQRKRGKNTGAHVRRPA